MPNIPTTAASVPEKLRFAEHYISVGWKIFLVRPSKSTYPNCQECAQATVGHNPATCGHLICHAHYAGSSDIERIRQALTIYPNGLLAVSTGQMSDIAALDFDVKTDDHNNPDELTGLDVLDRWEQFTGIELAQTLTQRTGSGGIHKIYRIPLSARITSRNRILPGVDVKANGGYIVVPPAVGRSWLTRGLPVEMPADLIAWLTRRRGGSGRSRLKGPLKRIGGDVSNIDMQEILSDGCPIGCRDEFFNSLIFQLRKMGIDSSFVVQIAAEQWEKAEKLRSGDTMSWDSVRYKIDRIFRLIEPDPDIAAGVSWAISGRQTQRDQYQQGNPVQIGRVTITRRSR